MTPELEPCCAACKFWSPEYDPGDCLIDQETRGLPIHNSGPKGWCTHGGKKQGENIDRGEICGTYWETSRSGLMTAHDACCTEFVIRSD